MIKEHDYVEITAGKHKGVKGSVFKITDKKIYFSAPRITSCTFVKNAKVIRAEVVTRNNNKIIEFFYEEAVDYIKNNPNAGVFHDRFVLHNQEWIYYLVSDANNNKTEIGIINQRTFNELKENKIIGINVYNGKYPPWMHLPFDNPIYKNLINNVPEINENNNMEIISKSFFDKL